jgi:hypothetical protein
VTGSRSSMTPAIFPKPSTRRSRLLGTMPSGLSRRRYERAASVAVSAFPVTLKAQASVPMKALQSRLTRLVVSWWSLAPARRGKDTPRRSRNWRLTLSVCPSNR